MGAFSEFFSHLYTMTVIFFAMLLLEALVLIRSAGRGLWSSGEKTISTSRYMDFINKRYPAIVYRSEMKPELMECAVCLSRLEEGEETRELQCRHTFHKDCLDGWLQHGWSTCPLCRRSVLPEEIVVEQCRFQSELEYYGSDEELIFLLSALHGGNLYRFL